MERPSLSASDATTPSALSWRWGVKWADFAPEAMALGLFEAHWQEAGPYRDIAALDLNHMRFRALEGQRLLETLVVRDGFELVGYLWWVASRCSTAQAVTTGQIEAIYVVPSHRGPGLCGGLGWKMIKATIERLKERQIRVAKFAEKADRKIGAHLKRLGFEPMEVSYRMVLDEPKAAAS